MNEVRGFEISVVWLVLMYVPSRWNFKQRRNSSFWDTPFFFI